MFRSNQGIQQVTGTNGDIKNPATPAKAGDPRSPKWLRKNEVLRVMLPDASLPAASLRGVLTAFFVPARPSTEMRVSAWVCSVLWTIVARFWGRDERISLRAGRPASVGGGALRMPLPAAGRGVDRLGKRGGGEGGGPALGGSVAIEGGALTRLAAQRTDHGLHALGRHLLAVHGTGRTGDALVHQGAAEIVGAGREAEGGPLAAHLDPGGLNVGDQRVQCQPRYGVHQHRLAPGRAAAGMALEVDRRLHRHERQRHELGEPAGLRLQCADAHEVAGPVLVTVGMPVHDRDSAPEPDRVCGFHDFEPLGGLDLVGADHRADLVVEDLGCGAGERAEPRRLQLAQEVGDSAPEGLRTLPDLERRERVDVDARNGFLDRMADPEIGGAGIFRMNAALHADLGGASLPGFLDPPLDLREVEVIGPAAQILAELAL